MPFDNQKHAPRHAARHAQGGFGPDVTGYASSTSPYSAGRPMVGEDPVAGEGDAPRPIGVDPEETGAFQKLSSGEGAVLTSRDNAEEAAAAARSHMMRKARKGNVRLQGRNRPKVKSTAPRMQTNKKLFIGIAIAAAVVVIAMIVIFNNALSSTTQTQTGEDAQTQQEEQQVASNDTMTYHDASYGLMEQGGGWVLAKLDGSGNYSYELVQLSGTPVSLILYQGAFIIPENLDGTWDVIAYVPADGSVASAVVDSDGNPVGGSGQISEAVLDGSNLDVTTDSGTVQVSLM